MCFEFTLELSLNGLGPPFISVTLQFALYTNGMGENRHSEFGTQYTDWQGHNIHRF